MRESAAFSSRA